MRWRVALAMLCWAAVACHRAAAPAPVAAVAAPVEVALPPALSEWPTTLADAQRAHDAGNFDEADQVLQRYGLKYAGTAEGAESDFWRAVLKADPAWASPSARERIALFEAYLSAGSAAPHHTEALVFRRLLDAMDSTRAAIATLRTAADTRQRAREDEIKKLSDDLDRTMAELERIKKRLAPVKPPTG